MELYAISDLHVGFPDNAKALYRLRSHPGDWLIVPGDVGDTIEQFDRAMAVLTDRFEKVVWTAGNHELWSLPRSSALRGVERYEKLLSICDRRGVVTPEDPFIGWPASDAPRSVRRIIVPVLGLYDFSFRPVGVSEAQALRDADAAGIISADEYLLHTDPYPSIREWCAARIVQTRERLDRLPAECEIVVATHYPLLRHHAVLPRIPEYRVWCGTTRTEDWLSRYNIKVVVFGHLHIRRSFVEDGVRFEEVSLGYPNQWERSRGVDGYLRRILSA